MNSKEALKNIDEAMYQFYLEARSQDVREILEDNILDMDEYAKQKQDLMNRIEEKALLRDAIRLLSEIDHHLSSDPKNYIANNSVLHRKIKHLIDGNEEKAEKD